MSWLRLTGQLAIRAAVRPVLTTRLLRVAWRFRRRRWFRSPPFLPLPPPEYIRWRMYTAYGDERAVPSPREVERYVTWATRLRRLDG